MGDAYGVPSPVVFGTTDGGSTWTSESIPSIPLFDGLNSVSCASATTCVAGGYTGDNSGVTITTTDGGLSWSAGSVPAGITDITAVSCDSLSDCAAVEYGSVILTSTDQGVNWTSEPAPTGTNALAGIDCPELGECLAVGNFVTSGGGGLVLSETQAIPAITSAVPPAGTVGQPYSGTLGVAGGSGPYTWSLLSGSLPPGVEINTQTGAVTGVPLAGAVYTPTFEVSDASGETASASAVLAIQKLSPTIQLTVAPSAAFAGQLIDFSAAATGSDGTPTGSVIFGGSNGTFCSATWSAAKRLASPLMFQSERFR